MSNPLSGMFEDDNGGASSTRFVFVVGSMVFIGIWAYLCVKTGGWVPMTLKDLGILIILGGDKVGGKAFEILSTIKGGGV